LDKEGSSYRNRSNEGKFNISGSPKSIERFLLSSEKTGQFFIAYRHVILPAELARKVPRTHLMSETEWRNLGVQQSPGWIHFMIHSPGNRHQHPVRLPINLYHKLGQ